MTLSRSAAAIALLGMLVTVSVAQGTALPKPDPAIVAAAIHKPACMIPYNQQIEISDLATDVARTDWMSKLMPETPISLVSIPATHDAGTALARFSGTRCQVFSVPAQLQIGVRGFDIRLCVVGSELRVYHGPEDQRLTFEQVMKAFREFLAAHPNEFLVMRVREERKAIRPTETFAQAFEKFMTPELIYKANSRTDIPTVAQLRGKILLLDNYGKLPDAVDYPNPAMSVQDDYDISDMDKKYTEIVSKFEDALNEKTGATWHINYTSSSSLKVDEVANAVAINPRVDQYLTGKHGHLGLVLMNFPSVDMIEKIIDSN